jgi:hypothetical protein
MTHAAVLPAFPRQNWPRVRHSTTIKDIDMKRILAVLLVLPLAGCVVFPVDGFGKAGGGTALVCHKGKKTMELPREAVHAHLKHGDHRGPC